ncbi:hypothetical protein Sant_1490 [Sodalis praecaptivus]|uniref:Uncharacterized protein n=1 Tax=Sodalis praecaptivus TaxID=1239307 RepID=W0HWN4_9GAMM|nr:hypothetical protein Sant_1490 [Sodalis praecaptivus]
MAVYVKVIFPQRENGIIVVVVNSDGLFIIKGHNRCQQTRYFCPYSSHRLTVPIPPPNRYPLHFLSAAALLGGRTPRKRRLTARWRCAFGHPAQPLLPIAVPVCRRPSPPLLQAAVNTAASGCCRLPFPRLKVTVPRWRLPVAGYHLYSGFPLSRCGLRRIPPAGHSFPTRRLPSRRCVDG